MNNDQTKTKLIEKGTKNIIKGINNSADVIISTMGGYGQNVILATDNDMSFTKDGVSVADYLKLTDPIENIGSKLLIDAANKTVDQCGDGTTLTCLFTKTLANNLTERIEKGEDVNTVLENLDDFTEQYQTELMKRTKKIDSFEEIYQIAKTSTKSPSLAVLITDIYKKAGYDAVITPEISRMSTSTYYEIINGLNFESGMVNSRFANQDNNSCSFDMATIILEDGVVSDFGKYVQTLDEIKKKDASIVIIAPQFSDTFIQHCLTNKLKFGLKICLVKSPGYAKGVGENYKDIIAFSNSDNTVNKIVITEYDMTIYNTPNENKIEKRINRLQKLADSAIESYDEEDYRNRIIRLKQAGAIIYVGGITDKSAKEAYDRLEDGIGAVRSSLKEGYVRGAGCELYNIAEQLKDHPFKGSSILKAPLTQILTNAKIEKLNMKYDEPYNVILKGYDPTVIDPTDVLINSFVNAASLVKLLINTSYIVYND